MSSKQAFLCFLVLICILAFFPQMDVFLFPGLFIIFSDDKNLYDDLDFLKTLSHTMIFSLAFWVLTYWITMLIHVKLTILFYACNIFFTGLFCRRFRGIHLLRTSSASKEDSLLLLLFLLLCFARLAPFLDRITGSTGDMSQHNYMTKIIMLHNGYTDSYEPVAPFGGFGEYPLGFHTVCALVSLLGKMQFYRVTNFMSSVSFILLHLSLYVFLRKSFSKILSLSVSFLALFLSHYPQFLNQWGSGPTALSCAFLFFFWNILAGLYEERAVLGRLERLGVASVGAAGFLSHLVPPLGFLLYFGAFILLDRLLNRGSLRTLLSYWEIFAFALLFCVPYLAHFDFSVFQATRHALALGHESSYYKVVSILNTPLPFHMNTFLWPLVEFSFVFGPAFSVLVTGSALYLWIKGNKTDHFHLIQFLGACVLFIAIVFVFTHRLIFFYHLLQAERVHYFILFPASWMIAFACNSICSKSSVHQLLFLAGIYLGFVILNYLVLRDRGFESHYTAFKNDRKVFPFLASDCLLGSYFSYAFDKVNSYCSRSDLEAFVWIRKNIPKDAVFLVNDGDSGPLIPSIAERKIFSPHGMDLWHSGELHDWQSRHSPTHIYIGNANSPRIPPLYTREELSSDRKKFKGVYHKDGVDIYEIVEN